MLITIDGRRIRANKRITYTVDSVSRDGAYVYLNEHHDDGTTLAGPTVTAAEWLRHEGNQWVSCNGSRRRPDETRVSHAGGHWTMGRCPVCGGWNSLRKDGAIWAHKRPSGQMFDADGRQVIVPMHRWEA